MPESEWDLTDEDREELTASWDSTWGDRSQEIVIIGRHLNRSSLEIELDRCLLSQVEVDLELPYWSKLSDPFPPWPIDVEDDQSASRRLNEAEQALS